MEHFGWINFLKTLAATKVFDIPGTRMNSIQCVRETEAFDVLIYASEDKMYNESLALDYKEIK
jgi:hypothetical protein